MHASIVCNVTNVLHVFFMCTDAICWSWGGTGEAADTLCVTRKKFAKTFLVTHKHLKMTFLKPFQWFFIPIIFMNSYTGQIGTAKKIFITSSHSHGICCHLLFVRRKTRWHFWRSGRVLKQRITHNRVFKTRIRFLKKIFFNHELWTLVQVWSYGKFSKIKPDLKTLRLALFKSCLTFQIGPWLHSWSGSRFLEIEKTAQDLKKRWARSTAMLSSCARCRTGFEKSKNSSFQIGLIFQK